MTTWFGVRPVWIAGPLLLYAAAAGTLWSEGQMGLVEAGFVLLIMGVGLPLLGFALTRALRLDRRAMSLADATCDDLEKLDQTMVGSAAAADVKLLAAIAKLWGADALKRVRFEEIAQPETPSRLASLLGLRS